MIWFTVETTYTQDRDALHAARPGHREYLSGLVEQGRVAAAGPWADDSAGFAVYRVADRDELDRLLAEDPYTTGGVVAGRTVNEWKIVLGSLAAQ
ncbi:hypothetical protein BLA60_20075 [Actinophytocola xinjiangensis]|uniref:YCII-related domain-containing protein n=1 Tax=Actinophytocola xinjiangensis TaxID=485602 RepID=A0A7Z0WKH4_9PSEU|nr:YciI family protein [Actinophytocola xinjiangensis]OLF09457.1 hypothetical protein BLA60_20075 [Actinophytocola xinjiangensis]